MQKDEVNQEKLVSLEKTEAVISPRTHIKNLFIRQENGNVNTKLQHIPTVILCGSIGGFLVGGRYGSKAAATLHIENTQLTIFNSTSDAHRVYHKAMISGYLRQGCRWGWRMGLFAGLYSLLTTVCKEARQKDDGSNYLISGAVTGAVYNIFSGYRSIIVGTVLGTCFSAPCAGLMLAMHTLLPYDWDKMVIESDTMVTKQKLEKTEQEWNEKLEVLNRIVNNYETDVNEIDNLSQNLEKIG